MGADNRMADRRVAVDLRLGRRERPLASDEVEHGPPSFDRAPHRLGQGIPRRRGTGELGVAQRQPVQIGDLERVQHRSRGAAAPCSTCRCASSRPRGGHRSAAVLGELDTTTISGLPGTLQRSPKMLNSISPNRRVKATCCGGRDPLVTEEDDPVFVVGALDRGEHRIVERPGSEIHPADLGAKRGAGRTMMSCTLGRSYHPWIWSLACCMVRARDGHQRERERGEGEKTWTTI